MADAVHDVLDEGETPAGRPALFDVAVRFLDLGLQRVEGRAVIDQFGAGQTVRMFDDEPDGAVASPGISAKRRACSEEIPGMASKSSHRSMTRATS